MGWTVGMVVNWQHAFNVIAVQDDGGSISLKWFEPQTDKWVQIAEGTIYNLHQAKVWW